MITKIKTSRVFLFNITATEIVTVNIMGNPSIEALKASIENAVLNYEILNCRILSDFEGEYYFVPREEIVKPYIEVRNSEQPIEQFVNEQSSEMFDLENGVLQRFILEPKDDCIVMNIVQHHIVGDGMSILMLIDKIMENLDTIDKQGGKLTLDVPVMKKVQPLTKADVEEYVQLNDLLKMTIEEFNNNWKEERKLFTKEDLSSLYKEYWKNNHANVRRETIDEKTMKYIVDKCREEKITVNSLLYTIAAKAFRESIKMGFVVNCRTSKFKSYGNYVNSLVFDGNYDDTKDFWENARCIHNIIKCKIRDLSEPMLGTLITNNVDGTLIDASYFRKMPQHKNKVVDDYAKTLGMGDEKITFLASNLGVAKIPETYGKYKIDSIFIGSPLDTMLNCNLGIITVNGKMTINAEYRDVEGIDFEYILDELLGGLSKIAWEQECKSEGVYENYKALQLA